MLGDTEDEGKMNKMNLLSLGRMKEFLLKINIHAIPITEEPEEVSFAIMLECASNQELVEELCNVLGIEIIDVTDANSIEILLKELNHFFEVIGEKYQLFLSIIQNVKKQQSDMVGTMMAQAILPKLSELMSTSTDLESFAKNLSEVLPKN